MTARKRLSNTADYVTKAWPHEYRAWINMRSRCNTPSSTGYETLYGGRGIRVCPEWEASFQRFLKDVGPRPSPRHSLDRIDGDGHYEPGNCRWATQVEQCRNLRTNHLVEVDGQAIPLAAAVEGTGLAYNTVLYRLKRGWTVEQALTRATRKGVRP